MEAIALIDSIPKKLRTRLLEQFEKLRIAPDECSDYQEHDSVGRRIEICIFGGYSIHYWIDFPDRHVKILAIKAADL